LLLDADGPGLEEAAVFRAGRRVMHQRYTRDISFTRWVFRAYLVLLFLVPLPLGSNRPLFWSLMVAAITLLMLVWSVGWLTGSARWPRAVWRAKWPLIALVLFVGWGGVKLLSGVGIETVDWQASLDAFLLSLGLLMMALLTILLVRSRRRALLVLYTLALAGLLQALYGSFLMFNGLDFGFPDQRMFGHRVAKGTFVNRNHYANILVLALSAGSGLLLAQMNLRGGENMRQRLRSLLQATLGPKARLRIYMVVMVIALVLTRSRMGNTAFFAAFTMVGLFALWRLRKPSRPLMILVVSVLVIDIFVVGTWFGVEKVIDRIQESVQVQDDQWVVKDKNRIDADRESLDIISKAPVAGFGGGTFYTVSPAWRGDDQQFMDHTHNDYLEFLVEYGLVGGGLLAWFLVLCLRQAARGLSDRDRAKQFGICFAGLMAMVAMMIHATVDFSLQIPANALWFVVLCMLPFTTCNINKR
jgi:O-antigen ligase